MPARETKFDSRIIIYRGRQFALGMFMFIGFLFFGAKIFHSIIEQQSWVTNLIPIIAIGSLYILFGPTEEWEYKAWQSKPQKIEQQSSGK